MERIENDATILDIALYSKIATPDVGRISTAPINGDNGYIIGNRATRATRPLTSWI
jgi:hypothetical protein